MTLRYAALVLVITAAAIGAVAMMGARLGPGVAQGAILGMALAAGGAVAGMALQAWAFDKDDKVFFAAVVAGILGRLFAYGAVLVGVALRGGIDLTAAAAGLLTLYLVFQALEIRFTVRGLKARRGASRS